MHAYAERAPLSLSGYIVAGAMLLVVVFGAPVALNAMLQPGPAAAFAVIGGLVLLLLLPGFYVVAPNTARVLTLLGSYVGTDDREGLRWTLPVLIARQNVSRRLRNFESAAGKVNDARGNPIEIAGVIVWRIASPAAATFGVEDVARYVSTQGDAAIRALAGSFPYGATDPGEMSLLSHPEDIADRLRQDMQARVEDVGVTITDARLSHLAYAPEIAAAMLQRQQADALVDAREVIVDGAVGIVGGALDRLRDQGIVDLTADQRAALVSNLLVVLSGDRTPQPVVQTGTQPRG